MSLISFESFQRRVAQVFQRSDVEGTMQILRDLGGDSVHLMELYVELVELGVELDVESLPVETTVRDLYEHYATRAVI